MQNIQIERARLYGAAADRRLRPDSHAAAALKCPRCGSLNTKFCYYNNYNLSQPRHFCKSCRRYWTKGGVLRNIPVGGGCRKTTKRSKSKIADVDPPIVTKSNGQSCSSSESSLTASNTTSCSAKLFEQAAIPADSDRQPPSVNNPPTAAEMHLSGELGFDIPSTTTSYEMEWGNDQALFDLTAYWTDNNHNNSLDYIP